MSDFYYDQPGLFTRMGLSSEMPLRPPDNQALFWAIDTKKIYAVDDTMNWYEINPDFPTNRGMESLTTAFHFDDYPSFLLLTTPLDNTLILDVRVSVTVPFDPGITVTIGDAGDVDRLMESDGIDLSAIDNTFESHPNFTYPTAGTAILAYLSGTSAAGAADVWFIYDRDSQA